MTAAASHPPSAAAPAAPTAPTVPTVPTVGSSRPEHPDQSTRRREGVCTPPARPAAAVRQARAADLPCLRHDGELWFAETPEGVERAKSLCGPCPLRRSCLAGALERGEPWGVWGGELLVHGEVVARKRPRGRPRKNHVAA